MENDALAIIRAAAEKHKEEVLKACKLDPDEKWDVKEMANCARDDFEEGARWALEHLLNKL